MMIPSSKEENSLSFLFLSKHGGADPADGRAAVFVVPPLPERAENASVFPRFLEDALAKVREILYNVATESFRDRTRGTWRNELCEEFTAR